MAHKKSYSRYFIILQEDEKGFAMSQDKQPSGYTKIEIKNDRCKISYYVQNIKRDKDPFYMILICNKRDEKKLVNIGILNIDDNGRADVSYEFDVNNIGGTGISAEKIGGAAIVKKVGENIVSPMRGFSSTDTPGDWRTYPFSDIVEKREELEKEEIKPEENKNESIMAQTETEDKIINREENKDEGIKKVEKKEKTDEKLKNEENIKIELEISEKKLNTKGEIASLEKDYIRQLEKDKNAIENNIFDVYEKKIEGEKIVTKDDQTLSNEEDKGKEVETLAKTIEDIAKVSEEKIDTGKCETKEEPIERVQADEPLDQYSDHIEQIRDKKDEHKNYPIGTVGEFFLSVAEGFEEIELDCPEIKKCRWYKVPISDMDVMCNVSNYNKYTIVYYPMINYYPYIKKYGHYSIGYKCDKEGKMKYIVYAIPGTKSKFEQPYGGKSGFVTWVPSKFKKGNIEYGYWLMFYDFRNSVVVVPMR